MTPVSWRRIALREKIAHDAKRRLEAAAPDMLDALKRCLKSNDPGVIAVASAAIAKAEGGEK